MNNRFVFIAGLHRTGTSLVARILGAHPSISAPEGTGVPEDEGCYLQGAIPHTALHGRPGHFAIDPKQHHIEGSPYDTLEARNRLLADWSPWFDPKRPWWLEKSPVNLTRMRLYQQLFPRSHFIVILRDPVMMAQALGKWSDASATELIRYGLDAYETTFRDLPFLHAAMVLRYEDLVARPDAYRKAMLAFLDLEDHDPGIAIRNGNADYEPTGDLPADITGRLAALGYGSEGSKAAGLASVTHFVREIKERVDTILN